MSELDTVVSVEITADTVTPTRQGFGTALLLTYHARFADQWRRYTGTAGMTADGFATKDKTYIDAKQIFSQNPSVTQIIVGRLPAAPTFTYKVTPTTAVAGKHIKCKVVDPTTGTVTQIDRTVPSSSSLAAEATAVAALIDAMTGVTGTAATNDVIVGAAAGLKPTVYDCVNCTVVETTADAGYDDELADLQLDNDEWYFVYTDSSSDANVEAVAAWVADQKKLYFWDTTDSRELTSGSVTGAALKAASAGRVAGAFATNPDEALGLAWIGCGAPKAPGSITWCYQQPTGCTPTKMTATQKGFLEANNMNHFMTVAGINVMRWGKVASGEYIDVVHGLDALEADIKESAFSTLVNNGKIGYTSGQLDLIASAILGALKRFEGVSGALLVDGSSTVTVPKPEDISLADKQERVLDNVTFTAELQGAVHTVKIRGKVTL